jgi:DNA-binding transcriptional regulator LsrR (DeoR family)
MPKHSQELIDRAHDLAFKGDLSNKEIAKKLNLTANQLHYILYTKQDSGYWIKDVKKIMEKAPPSGGYQVAVRLNRDVYERLDKYRSKTRISKTATIEQAIIEHLDYKESVTVPLKKPTLTESFLNFFISKDSR